MEFKMTIRNLSASISGISALVNGNSDYRIVIDYDADWNDVTRFLYVESIRADGSETRFFPVPNNAVNLPAFQNAEKLSFWLTGGFMRSERAELQCEPCITDGQTHSPPVYFDVYNAMMQYISDAMHGIPADQLAAEMNAIQTHTAQPVPESEYRAAIASGCVESRLRGTVKMENSASFSFTENDVLAGSFSINVNAMTGDFLLPGGVPSAELSCTFVGTLADYDLSGAEINVTYEVMTHLRRWYAVPLGTYTVFEPKKTGTNQLQITAYDAMMKLDSIPVSKLNITADTAYSPQEILQMISGAGGIPYTGNTDEYVNKNCTFMLSALDNTIDTLRDLLMYTAQILNCCAYIGRDGSLILTRIVYKDAAGNVGKRQIVQSQISAKRYQLYSLKTIIQYKENGVNVSNSTSQKTYWADGVYAELPENPLLRVLVCERDPEQERRFALGYIKRDLDFAVYYPAEIVQVSDPSVRLMEWVSFESRSGTVRIPITAYQWTFHGGMTANACGAEAIAGIRQTQAEKIASGERTCGDLSFDNFIRIILLMQIQQGGNATMEALKNVDLAHFTYAELSAERPPMTHTEMTAYTHEQLSTMTHGAIGE